MLQGVPLPHNAMTETLCFVVQGLFAVWFAVCGTLSLPLLCAPYLYLGLAFCVPYALYAKIYVRWRWGEKWLVLQKRATEEYERSSIQKYKDLWAALPELDSAQLLATELVAQRLLAYSIFAATVFGIQLWVLYGGRDYTRVLQHATRGASLSLPLTDLAALVAQLGELFRWPTELSLPAQLPLAVSLGFVGIDGLLSLWRTAGKRVAGTAVSSAVMLWRYQGICHRHTLLLPDDHTDSGSVDAGVAQAQAALDEAEAAFADAQALRAAAQAALKDAIEAAGERDESAPAKEPPRTRASVDSQALGEGAGAVVNPLGLDEQTIKILERNSNSDSGAALTAGRGTRSQPQPQKGHV